MMKKILLILCMTFVFSASPFYDSSVYIKGTQVNLKKSPSVNAETVLVAKNNMAFKYLETIDVNKISWYKLEYFDPTKYDIYYKPSSTAEMNPFNFSNMTYLYIKPDLSSTSTQIMPTIRNYKYDKEKAAPNNWVTVRLFKPQIAYIQAALVNKISRPYFLVETALEGIAANRWGSAVNQSVLKGEVYREMTPAMVKAVKGEPDSVYEDKTGRNLYYTWIYGGQAINFRANRVTSW